MKFLKGILINEKNFKRRLENYTQSDIFRHLQYIFGGSCKIFISSQSITKLYILKKNVQKAPHSVLLMFQFKN